jgi:hypothetical protein
MAQRRSYARTRTVYRTARRSARRVAGGSTKPLIDGALGGLAAQVGGKFLNGWGQPLGYIAVGMFRKNSTLTTLGGVALGGQIANMIPFLGNGNGNTGGFFQG